MRIGHGYDVHRLVEGRDLILGGVQIPYHLGLLGHSDADVLTHAVMDALNSVPFEPFPLRLDRLGNFGDLYWAGIADNPQLAAFVKRLRRALADRNIPFDRKRFSPHITLVRKAEYYGETPLPPVHAPEGEMEVTGVVLMRSDRGKHGMIYTEVGKIGE